MGECEGHPERKGGKKGRLVFFWNAEMELAARLEQEAREPAGLLDFPDRNDYV